MSTFSADNHSIEIRLIQLGDALRREPTLADAIVANLQTGENLVHLAEASPDRRVELPRVRPLWRFALSGVAAVALMAATLTMLAWPSRPLLAQVAQNVRRASSYSVEFSVLSGFEEEGRQSREREVGRIVWRRPNDFRVETQSQPAPNQPAVARGEVKILFADKPGICWDHESRKFWPEPAKRGHMSPLVVLEDLERFAENATRRLGTQVIDGVSCEGFEIQTRAIDADIRDGLVTLWIDRERRLPVQLTIDLSGSPTDVMVFKKFAWNIELSEKLFSIDPPEGFERAADRTVPGLDEETAMIVQALKVYCELSMGRYPQVKVIYGDTMRDQMFALAGYAGRSLNDYHREDTYPRILQAGRGFAAMSAIMGENADATYYGQSVTAEDKDKVLFRWKLDDGRYQVIYGDLRSETVIK